MTQNQPAQGLYDIYDITYVPFWQTKTFLIILAVLIFGLLIAGAWWLRKRRKKRSATSWERALAYLDLLVPDEHNTHSFYEQLTTIIKQYLENRYTFSLIEKTDEEMVDCLDDLDIPESLRPQLKEFFARVVAYKFGKAATSTQQMMADAHMISTVIQQTIPQEKGN
jgi:hypothetical protein